MAYLLAQADAVQLPLSDYSVDLVLGSPPYMEQRTYGIGAARRCEAWVAWMLGVTEEALRVTRGAVVWVVAGATKNRRYQPGPEMLLADAWRRGWGMEAPCYFHRHGISGSGGTQWFRKDIEYCLCFKAVDELPWSNAKARGRPPKYKAGGAMSHRRRDGKRVTARRSDGRMETQRYVPPDVSNPGNLVHCVVGGGRMGHPLAHQNAAPYPESLADFFIATLCPPGGVCLDPFSGSGTTAAVAERLGRVGVGFDVRMSQCLLGKRRIERPHAPVAKRNKANHAHELFR